MVSWLPVPDADVFVNWPPKVSAPAPLSVTVLLPLTLTVPVPIFRLLLAMPAEVL